MNVMSMAKAVVSWQSLTLHCLKLFSIVLMVLINSVLRCYVASHHLFMYSLSSPPLLSSQQCNQADSSNSCIVNFLVPSLDPTNPLSRKQIQGQIFLQRCTNIFFSPFYFTSPEIIGVKACDRQTDKSLTQYTRVFVFFLHEICYLNTRFTCRGIPYFPFLKKESGYIFVNIRVQPVIIAPH